MKIFQVIRSLGLGGAERVVVDLSIELNKMGHEVEILILKKNHNLSLEEELLKKGIKLRKFEGINNYISMFKLCKFLLFNKADIIHTHLGAINYIVPIIPFINVKLIHTLHNEPKYILGITEGKTFNNSFVKNNVYPVVLGKRFGKEFEKFMPGTNYSVIPNGINYDRLNQNFEEDIDIKGKFNIPCDHKVIILIGRAEYQKSVETSIKVLEELPKNYHLILALSGGSLINELKEQINNSQSFDRIHLVLNSSNIPQLVKESDTILMTSRFEGMPITILEGMYLKKPIVSTNVGCIPEILINGENGFTCEVNNIKAMVDNIILINNSQFAYNGMIEKAFLDVTNNYSSKTMAYKYVDLYNEVLE